MTSRPAQGIQESLQHRGSAGPPRPQARRQPSKPISNPSNPHPQDTLDTAVEDTRRPTEDSTTRCRGPPGTSKPKPPPLEGIQTTSHDIVRPLPKGKPQVFFSSLTPSASDVIAVQSPHTLHISNLPVPPRPARPGEGAHQRRIVPGGTGVKSEVATKPPVYDAHPLALVFPEGKTADLFPWTGNNPEDVLNDGLVKTGVSNKPQIMNETNTARPSLWSNLKNKSGVSTLSNLFVAVLEKRQACGRLSVPNSFKPPPRLTLRDSTRENWLHDLANPTVNLRRLSRTIPHGITGKVLLEQCLNKNIPLPRAVWLAKCVGINEMRSHKRKGQAGTITWVRGWTSSVEQFLDSTIATIGQHDWKPRITYALQLATQLYNEHLLEDDHYVDWVLKNLDACVPERLFLWLLLITLYWSDLTTTRRRGRRLAESLLAHADRLHQLGDDNPATSILSFLEKTIAKLLAFHPSCLLLPKHWAKIGPLLRTIAQRHPHPQINRAIEQLGQRNARVSISRTTTNATHDSARQVLSVLDSIDYSSRIDVDQIAYDCMELMNNAQDLISLCLQWASTLYRDGLHRVYLATRLIRKWGQLGADIDQNILSYLLSMPSKASCDPQNVFKIIAELVRSKSFSVSRYLQWLIATGSVNRDQDLTAPTAWPLRLITEIPLTGLPEQVRNLRSTLLRSTPHSAESEEQNLDDAEQALREHLPHLFGQIMLDNPSSALDITSFSSTIKLEMAIFLRQQVAANVETMDRVPTKDVSIEVSGPVCSISVHDFQVVRTCLEQLGDLAMLADIIGVVTTSLDSTVLAAATDTLHYNQEAFSAIGAFDPLFEKIAMRYAAIRTIKFPERELLISLVDLTRSIQADTNLKQILTYDLGRLEQKNSVAACSPVSDTMAEAVHNSALDSDEEIDRVLSSGTSVDQQIMARVFGKIVLNLEDQVRKGTPPSGNHCSWFHRLRSFDENAFDGILAEWVKSLLVGRQTSICQAAIPVLVASGCLSMFQFQQISRTCISKQKSTNIETVPQLCADIFDIILPSEQLNTSCQPQEGYRFRLEQRRFSRDPEGQILGLVAYLIEVVSPISDEQTTTMMTSVRLLAVLRYFAVNSRPLFSSALNIGSKESPEVLSRGLLSLLHHLVDPAQSLGLAEKSLEQQVAVIVDNADHLSLPFCQFALKQIFSVSLSSPESSMDTVSAALLQAVKNAVEQDQSTWCDLIAGLESDLTNKIREHAERELLNASAVLVTPGSGHERPDGFNAAFIQKYLTVIDYTASETCSDGDAAIIPALVERLRGIVEAFGRSLTPQPALQAGSAASPTLLIGTWLNALLRLAVVHGPAQLAKAPSQHQAALMWNLRLLFTCPVLAKCPSMADFTFDVATLLSDSISDDVRNHLSKTDTIKSANDARCAFVFGLTAPLDGWLVVSKPLTPPSLPATSSPQPQTQQAVQVQSQQQPSHQQIPGQGSMHSMQRSLSQQQQQAQGHGHNQGRMYSQYPQSTQQNKMLSQFQRMANAQNSPHSQLQQMQQMQQMQALAQQRSMQPSPVQMQRQAASNSHAGTPTNRPTSTKQDKTEMKQMSFALKRWEILPESGGNPAGNETAISLSLFGARKV